MSKNTQLGNLVNGIYVDSTGKVGVGTTSPAQKLDVYGRIRVTNPSSTTQFLEIYTDSGSVYYNAQNNSIQNTAYQHIFFTDGTSPVERLRIATDGKIGIGSSSPSTQLDVRGTPSADWGNLTLFDSRTAATGQGGVITFSGYKTSTTAANIFAKIAGGNENGNGTENGYLSFITNTGTAYAERMRILSGGNIQIGGTNFGTDAKLGISNNNAEAIEISPALTSNTGRILFYNRGTSTYTAGLLVASEFQFQTGGTARMYLTADGKISIPYTTLAYTGNMTMYWNNSTGVVGVLTSSRRFKKDIVSLTSEQAKIALLLNPVEYTRLETNEREYGFIAEEVKEAGLGLLVPEMDGSPITVDYARISVIAIAMIKEQEKAIQELKAEIDILKNK